MIKWTFIIGGSLAALIGLAIVIGALLPRDHVASSAATIKAPQEAVWRLITDVAAASTWRDLEKVEMIAGASTPRWKEYAKHGRLTFEQVESVPPSKFVTRIVDTDQGFGGTWTFALAPASGDGTRVTITENGFITNPMFRFMSRFVFGYYGMQTQYLK